MHGRVPSDAAGLLTVGEDKGATAVGTNRPDVLGSAHDLSNWVDENPIK